MSKKPTVRFAVVDPVTGRHSGVWRVWVNNLDVYLAPRKDAATYKVSLHPGLYVIAYTSDHWATGEAPNNAPGPGRQVVSYPPSEIVDGVQHAWKLGFQLEALLENHPLDDTVVQITPATPDEFAQVDVWICDPSVTARPKHPIDPSPLTLRDGREVWVGWSTWTPEDQDLAMRLRRDYPTALLTFEDRHAPHGPPGLMLRPMDVK